MTIEFQTPAYLLFSFFYSLNVLVGSMLIVEGVLSILSTHNVDSRVIHVLVIGIGGPYVFLTFRLSCNLIKKWANEKIKSLGQPDKSMPV